MRIIRLIAIGAWGIPGAILAAADRWPGLSPLYAPGVAAAAAVTAAALTIELSRLDGDQVYDSCLRAVGDHQTARDRARRQRAAVTPRAASR